MPFEVLFLKVFQVQGSKIPNARAVSDATGWKTFIFFMRHYSYGSRQASYYQNIALAIAVTPWVLFSKLNYTVVWPDDALVCSRRVYL